MAIAKEERAAGEPEGQVIPSIVRVEDRPPIPTSSPLSAPTSFGRDREISATELTHIVPQSIFNISRLMETTFH